MSLELGLKLLNHEVLGREVLLQLEESCSVHVECGVEIDALSDDLAVVARCVAGAWSSWDVGAVPGREVTRNLGGSVGFGDEGEGVEVEETWMDGI